MTGSTTPEFMLILNYALGPVAEFFDQHMSTDVGFGQYTWTQKVAASMLADADNGRFDLMEAVSLSNLDPLSSMLQAQGIPYGLLVEEDRRFERTPLTNWIPCMTTQERVKWSRRMCPTTTVQWHTGVMPISNPRNPTKGDGTSEEGKVLDIEEIINYYLKFPGRIFAVRLCEVEDKPWHHPSCRSLDRRGKPRVAGGNMFEFRDLMSEGHPGVPAYLQMWRGLGTKNCCGWMWKESFAIWAGCEQSYPKILRLMTANSSHLNMYGRVLSAFQLWYTTGVSATQVVLAEIFDGPSSNVTQEVTPGIYWGDFYQPRLFTTLCDDLFKIMHKSGTAYAPLERPMTVILKWGDVTDGVLAVKGPQADETKEPSVL